MVQQAEGFAHKMDMPFPSKMWYSVIEDHNGWLPIKIESLPDGSYVPKGTPFAKVKNTVIGFGELVTWFETVFLQSSFDSGCATRAFNIRQYLEDMKLPLNRVHSFGLRGHNSWENAEKAGKAWRLFLNGTDDFHTQALTDGLGKSIPATAHKTIQQFDDELEAYYYSIDQTKAHGFNIVALVIDTYDPIRFIKYYAQKVAKYGKDKGVYIVFRPDSGLVKDQAFSLWCSMWSAGLIKNTSCIIGEGITFDKVKEYDSYFLEMGCNLDWFNYGMGSGFYKDIDRDFLGFAMKTAFSNGQNRMKFSADKFKESLTGDVYLVNKVFEGDLGEEPEWIRPMTESMTVTLDPTDSLYRTLYDTDGYSEVFSWGEIKNRAEKYVNFEQQDQITIGEDVKEEIEILRSKYITNITPTYD